MVKCAPVHPHQYPICILLELTSPYYHDYNWHTSSTAQGGGGSFKNRKPIGEACCCGAKMAERTHWWIERWLCVSAFLSFSFSCSLSLSFGIYLQSYLASHLPIYLSIHVAIVWCVLCILTWKCASRLGVAYTCSASQLPKVVRDRQFFTLLTWQCSCSCSYSCCSCCCSCCCCCCSCCSCSSSCSCSCCVVVLVVVVVVVVVVVAVVFVVVVVVVVVVLVVVVV